MVLAAGTSMLSDVLLPFMLDAERKDTDPVDEDEEEEDVETVVHELEVVAVLYVESVSESVSEWSSVLSVWG